MKRDNINFKEKLEKTYNKGNEGYLLLKAYRHSLSFVENGGLTKEDLEQLEQALEIINNINDKVYDYKTFEIK